MENCEKKLEIHAGRQNLVTRHLLMILTRCEGNAALEIKVNS